MGTLSRLNFDKPDEVHPFQASSGKLELVNTESGQVGRATFEPGWKWSTHVKPIAGTDSCQSAHVGYFISGRMKIVMDNGEEAEFGPGDAMVCPPGHDARGAILREGCGESRAMSRLRLPLGDDDPDLGREEHLVAALFGEP